MPIPILATKLHFPPLRQNAIPRPGLVSRLRAGASGKLTLVSAPAGFGKTTVVSEWMTCSELPSAWLSLDAGDSDPKRFLTYLVTALQRVSADLGKGVLVALESPQPPPLDTMLSGLINEIAALADTDSLILVLDDYHLVDAEPVDAALTYLLEYLPPQLHLVVVTREDPRLSLAQLRARGQLTELRAKDLRFSSTETTGFLNQAMGLSLSAADITALESRTEGWVAGLQLAALSMRNHEDTHGFIQSFTGSHHYVLDYLVEEVLNQQPLHIQRFLLHTSILDRMCLPLCKAVLGQDLGNSEEPMLEALERANLFIVPLDNERRWYRYHHLFAQLLRQRLPHSLQATGAAVDGDQALAELHLRASQWYEDNGQDIEAFHHATVAHDISRALHLIESRGLPLQFRGGAVPILSWLETLPKRELDKRPVLWITWASALLMLGQVAGVAEKAQAAEDALPDQEPDAATCDLIGRIASIRASVGVTQHRLDDIITQSRRALEYLSPNNLPVRASISWTLGYAYHLQGDRVAASQAYSEAVSNCLAVGHKMIATMATLGLGQVQEVENLLHPAAATFLQALELAGDPPPPPLCEAYLGLARINYQWNDLEAAQEYGEQSLKLAKRIENTDRFVANEVFLAYVKIAQGDISGAKAMLAATGETARRHKFQLQISEVAAAELLIALRKGNISAASELAEIHQNPLSQARIYLAQSDAVPALAILEPMEEQFVAKKMKQERLKVLALLAVARHVKGDRKKAISLFTHALELAEPGGYVRAFVDEGALMADLLAVVVAEGVKSDYIDKLLSAFIAEGLYPEHKAQHGKAAAQPLLEPMTERELEVLRLIAQGLSNQEISEKLFRALSTIKGHNRTIFDKLQVQRRTEAIARARELGLL